jgi:hypothetical protein
MYELVAVSSRPKFRLSTVQGGLERGTFEEKILF